ncbi:MAG: YjfK family protein [Pseudomonadota bacterium]|nr:YjfK family protein [Pseudomonadota bacterium]
MSLFARLFGQRGKPGAGTPQVDPNAIPHPLPLGMRVNGAVQFDRTMYRVAPGAMSTELPVGHQPIPCYGHVDLGDGYALHRFYLHDDAFVQVSTCGGQVEAIKAFNFHETVNPPTKDAFQEFVLHHDHLGAPTIEYAGKTWQRATQSTAGNERIPAIAYDEVLYRHAPPRRDDDLTHYAMLYRRPVPELDRDEFLLVTGEDSGPDDFSITYAIGVDLTQADLDIT